MMKMVANLYLATTHLKFDLKNVVPATSGSTLNPTRKSAAISQDI